MLACHSTSASVARSTIQAEEDVRWYATTDQHPQRVNMVNDVKQSLGLSPNGAFHINEYHQVIVPTVASEDYYFAGIYNEPLRFDFDGRVLSGDPVDLDGNPLSPGDTWVGPHPGIPYILAAGGQDIRYTTTRAVRRGLIEQTVRLSKTIGQDRAARVAARIRDVKGFSGGRLYVNEFHTIFAPLQEGGQLRYVFIGALDLAEWFPMPHAP
jgi:hypothetical protein